LSKNPEKMYHDGTLIDYYWAY